MNGPILKAIVGYVCATAIVIVMVLKDGDLANGTAAAVGIGLAGLGSYAVGRARAANA